MWAITNIKIYITKLKHLKYKIVIYFILRSCTYNDLVKKAYKAYTYAYVSNASCLKHNFNFFVMPLFVICKIFLSFIF